MPTIDGDKIKLSLSAPSLIIVVSAFLTGSVGATWWLAAQANRISENQTQAVQNSKDLAELRKITTDLASAQASAAVNQSTTSQQFVSMKEDFIDLRDRVKALEARRP